MKCSIGINGSAIIVSLYIELNGGLCAESFNIFIFNDAEFDYTIWFHNNYHTVQKLDDWGPL